MCNRIDSTTLLLQTMFLNCFANAKQVMEISEVKHKMCNKCVLVDEEENYKIFQFEFNTEKLQYKFDYVDSDLLKRQKISNITFIGFCD